MCEGELGEFGFSLLFGLQVATHCSSWNSIWTSRNKGKVYKFFAVCGSIFSNVEGGIADDSLVSEAFLWVFCEDSYGMYNVCCCREKLWKNCMFIQGISLLPMDFLHPIGE